MEKRIQFHCHECKFDNLITDQLSICPNCGSNFCENRKLRRQQNEIPSLARQTTTQLFLNRFGQIVQGQHEVQWHYAMSSSNSGSTENLTKLNNKIEIRFRKPTSKELEHNCTICFDSITTEGHEFYI